LKVFLPFFIGEILMQAVSDRESHGLSIPLLASIIMFSIVRKKRKYMWSDTF